MNALSRFERLDDMFPEAFRRFMKPAPVAGFDAPAEIRIDVTENEQGYEVRAEVPGARKEDIRVSVDGNFVSISAEVKREKEERGGKPERTLLRELYVGTASRGFSLAHEVEAKAAIAKYDNGVLKLSLPKKQESSSRTLDIQ